MFPSINLNPSHYSLTLQKLYTCGVIITLKKMYSNVPVNIIDSVMLLSFFFFLFFFPYMWAMNYEAIIMALITLQ